MKIRIRSTKTARRNMLKFGVPSEVVQDIAGKTFDFPSFDDRSGSYIIPAPLGSMNRIGHWNIAPECVEILEE